MVDHLSAMYNKALGLIYSSKTNKYINKQNQQASKTY